VSFILFGINRIGDHIQQPYGMGPHDLPLERCGKAFEQELYLFFPYFKFRFEPFPLFVDDLQVLPPNDPQALRKRSLYVESMKSPWVITRIKILAVVRMGTKKFSRFREAYSRREQIVRHLVSSRQNQAFDLSALLQALTVQPGDGHSNQAVGAKMSSKYSSKMMKASIESREDMEDPPATSAPHAITKHLPDSPHAVDHVSSSVSPPAKKPDPAPAELKQSTLVKQATMLARKFPDSLSLQHMLLQMTNPKTLTADKRGILAIMVSEAQMLSQALDLDLEEP